MTLTLSTLMVMSSGGAVAFLLLWIFAFGAHKWWDDEFKIMGYPPVLWGNGKLHTAISCGIALVGALCVLVAPIPVARTVFSNPHVYARFLVLNVVSSFGVVGLATDLEMQNAEELLMVVSACAGLFVAGAALFILVIEPRYRRTFYAHATYQSYLKATWKEAAKLGTLHMTISQRYPPYWPCLLYTSPSPRDS